MIFRLLILLILSVTTHGESEQPVTANNVVVMGDNKFAITISALRDTGPVTRMDASGLIVKVDVFSVDRKSLPETFRILQATVSSKTQFWNMDDSKDITLTRYFDTTGYSIVFRNGPPWSIGEYLSADLEIDIGTQALQYSTSRIEIKKN